MSFVSIQAPPGNIHEIHFLGTKTGDLVRTCPNWVLKAEAKIHWSIQEKSLLTDRFSAGQALLQVNKTKAVGNTCLQ